MGIRNATYITCSVVPDGKRFVDEMNTYPTKPIRRKKQQKTTHSDDVQIESADEVYLSDDES